MAIHSEFATLDGVTDLTIFDYEYQWGLTYNSLPLGPWQLDNPDGFALNLTFSGEWFLASLQVGDNGQGTRLTINDQSTDVWIGYLWFWDVLADITLRNASVDVIAGGRRNVSLTLGDGYVGLINLSDGADEGDGAGHSIALGAGAVDTIRLGDGDNTIAGDTGFVGNIEAGDGDDVITTQASDFGVIAVNDGDDTVRVQSDGHFIHLGNGNNLLEMGKDSRVRELIKAGHGNDTLTLDEGARAATVNVDGGNNTIFLGEGSRLDALETGAGDDSLKLSDGTRIDVVELNEGNDIITIGDGARIDYLRMGVGHDRLALGNGSRVGFVSGWAGDNGSDGNQVITLTGDDDDANDRTRISTLALDDGNDRVILTGDARIELTKLEGGTNVFKSETGHLGTIIAGNGANDIDIGTGSVELIRIYGDVGNGFGQEISTEGYIDRLRVESMHRSEVVVETGGNIGSMRIGDLGDTLKIRRGGAVQDADLGGGTDKVTLEGGTYVELLRTREGADRVELFSDAKAGTIYTEDGGDTVLLTGASHIDILETGRGNDRVVITRGTINTLNLGADDDQIEIIELAGATDLMGGSGVDTLIISELGFGVSLDLGAQGYQYQSNGAALRLFDIQVIRGTLFSDTLTGTGEANRLNGAEGDDVIFGGGGADTITGNKHFDDLYGGDGNDFLSGGKGFDTLKGGNGNDTLNGDTGRDTLIGENGNDLLTGGDGTDSFFFDDDDGYDRISDFELGLDVIGFEGAGDLGDIAFFSAGGGANTRLEFGNTTVVVEGMTRAQMEVSDNFTF